MGNLNFNTLISETYKHRSTLYKFLDQRVLGRKNRGVRVRKDEFKDFIGLGYKGFRFIRDRDMAKG